MNINKSIKPETQVIVKARRYVIISFSILLIYFFIISTSVSLWLTIYQSSECTAYTTIVIIYNTIYILIVTNHAFLCGKLWTVISKKILWAYFIGILIVVSILFTAVEILVSFILTIYLLVKSSSVLKKIKNNQ
jgi:hypothetical protein